jgi:hypothetical protein
MQRTNIYLEDQQTRALDRLARTEGVSRAEMIRRIIDRALLGEADSRATLLAAIDASAGAARDVETVSRGESDRDRHLDRVRDAVA